MPRPPAATPNPALGAILALALVSAAPVQAEVRDFGCAPTAVKVDEKRIEILCAEPMVLNDRAQDRFRQVERIAFPMISQNFQPQFGSQVKLLDYYLDLAETALVHRQTLHVWFESDYSRSQIYGCDPTNCREIVALALTHEAAPEPAIEGTLPADQ
jgi:hypothetical protein